MSEPSPDLAMRLGDRLRSEGIEDVKVNADDVYVVSGQLAAVYSLNFPESLADDQKTKITEIAREECLNYLQSAHNSIAWPVASHYPHAHTKSWSAPEE